MLSLTRREGEVLVFRDRASGRVLGEMTVVGVVAGERGRVKLGLEFGKGVEILRSELVGGGRGRRGQMVTRYSWRLERI